MTAITKIIHDHRFYCIWVTDILYHSKVLNSLITFFPNTTSLIHIIHGFY